jgi:hypothetical protein
MSDEVRKKNLDRPALPWWNPLASRTVNLAFAGASQTPDRLRFSAAPKGSDFPMSRSAHAERIDADHWRVPADLPVRGQAYDLARDRASIRMSILSHHGLDQQIRSDGATWLDRELASPDRTTLANAGFGHKVSEAMERRRQNLVNMGHAVRLEDGRIRVSKDFVANLERTEVNRVGKAMAAERGLTFTAAKTGEYVSGTLVGSAQLASGRFAMIDDGIGFQLVPWQPVLDKRIGQHITGTVRAAGGIEWSFGRKRGLGI